MWVSFYLSYIVLSRNSSISKIRVLPSEYLPQTLDLENFAAAIRSCFQQNSSTVELVDDTYDGRRVVAVYYTPVDLH